MKILEDLMSQSLTNKILILLGVVGVPFCGYVIYDELVGFGPVAVDINNVKTDEWPALLIPTAEDESKENIPMKVELYEETLERQERWKKGNREVKDPFKEIMDERFFEVDKEGESGKEPLADSREQGAGLPTPRLRQVKAESRGQWGKYAEWYSVQEERGKPTYAEASVGKSREQLAVGREQSVESTSVDRSVDKSMRQRAERNKAGIADNIQIPQDETSSAMFSFYSGGEKTSHNGLETTIPDQSIEAVVHNDQEVGNNSSLRIRILEQMVLSGKIVPANSIVWGNVSFGRDRVGISFTGIEVGNQVIDFDKEAYGKDGLEGIPVNEIPGASEVFDDVRDDGLRTIRRQSRVVRGIADGLDAVTDSKKKIVFKDGYPFFIK